jgi:hypothetical protein
MHLTLKQAWSSRYFIQTNKRGLSILPGLATALSSLARRPLARNDGCA